VWRVCSVVQEALLLCVVWLGFAWLFPFGNVTVTGHSLGSFWGEYAGASAQTCYSQYEGTTRRFKYTQLDME